MIPNTIFLSTDKYPELESKPRYDMDILKNEVKFWLLAHGLKRKFKYTRVKSSQTVPCYREMP